MSKRKEFSPSVRVAAYERAKDAKGVARCQKCTARLVTGKFQYDHVKPDGLGGKPTLDNCMVLCDSCHSGKTHGEDNPIMQKADRQKKASIGAKTEPSKKIESRGFVKKERVSKPSLPPLGLYSD